MFDRRSLGIYLAPAYVERVSAFICSLYIQINFAPALMLELGLQTIFSMLKVAIKKNCLRCGLHNVPSYVVNLMLPFGNITVCFDDVCFRTFTMISEFLF